MLYHKMVANMEERKARCVRCSLLETLSLSLSLSLSAANKS